MAIPKELQSVYDKCVKKVQANGGKNESEARGICELSVSSMIPAPKEKAKPWKTVSNKENEHHLFFSNSTVDTKDSGTVLKNVEIFKAGTYRGIEYKKSALEKMVANFYFLKSMDIFAHVPVRSDHPDFWGGGDVIDKVGGYVKDLRVVGTKLVADIRITSEKMLGKIKEGSYVCRSSEIGMYRDNEGNAYDPVLWGFAWVDIPAVEGLSPKFSFSKDKDISLVNLNEEDMKIKKESFDKQEEEVKDAETEEKDGSVEETVSEEVVEGEVKEEEETTETVVEDDAVEAVESTESDKVEETASEEEEAVEESVVEEKPADEELKEGFSKAFPNEFAELQKFREGENSRKVEAWMKDGKTVPAQKDAEIGFLKTLSADQMAMYEKLKEESPAIVKLEAEHVEETAGETEQGSPENESQEPTSSEKADTLLKLAGE